MNIITQTQAVKLQQFVTTEFQENLICEVPVALVYNGISHAVMMTTPQDLEDFALGFSLAEGILTDKQELYGLDVIEQCNGIEVQMEIATRQFVALKERRRSMTGRTGCGICGVEQLEQVSQSCKFLQKNDRLQAVNPQIFDACLQQLEQAQRLAQQTGASHAAAFFLRRGNCLQFEKTSADT